MKALNPPIKHNQFTKIPTSLEQVFSILNGGFLNYGQGTRKNRKRKSNSE